MQKKKKKNTPEISKTKRYKIQTLSPSLLSYSHTHTHIYTLGMQQYHRATSIIVEKAEWT